VPAAALAGQLLDLGEVAPELAVLPEQLDGMDDADGPTMCRHVFRALGRAVARHGDAVTRPAVARGLAGLARGGRVGDVADEVGFSRKRFTALVREETGLSAKAFQRVARFEASRPLVGRVPLAQAAAATGYADQGHLAREWSEMAGCSPSTWLREEFPFVQDTSGVVVAG
jgi:AraC-like DNA-binding protein